jgi:hypothetical protein
MLYTEQTKSGGYVTSCEPSVSLPMPTYAETSQTELYPETQGQVHRTRHRHRPLVKKTPWRPPTRPLVSYGPLFASSCPPLRLCGADTDPPLSSSVLIEQLQAIQILRRRKTKIIRPGWRDEEVDEMLTRIREHRRSPKSAFKYPYRCQHEPGANLH